LAYHPAAPRCVAFRTQARSSGASGTLAGACVAGRRWAWGVLGAIFVLLALAALAAIVAATGVRVKFAPR